MNVLIKLDAHNMITNSFLTVNLKAELPKKCTNPRTVILIMGKYALIFLLKII